MSIPTDWRTEYLEQVLKTRDVQYDLDEVKAAYTSVSEALHLRQHELYMALDQLKQSQSQVSIFQTHLEHSRGLDMDINFKRGYEEANYFSRAYAKQAEELADTKTKLKNAMTENDELIEVLQHNNDKYTDLSIKYGEIKVELEESKAENEARQEDVDYYNAKYCKLATKYNKIREAFQNLEKSFLETREILDTY